MSHTLLSLSTRSGAGGRDCNRPGDDGRGSILESRSISVLENLRRILVETFLYRSFGVLGRRLHSREISVWVNAFVIVFVCALELSCVHNGKT